MAIIDNDLTGSFITTREAGDSILSESYVTQDGALHKGLQYGRKRLEFRVFMPAQTGDTASEAEWRTFLKKATIVFGAENWTCIEEPPFTVEYLDDDPTKKILRFILTNKAGYTT